MASGSSGDASTPSTGLATAVHDVPAAPLPIGFTGNVLALTLGGCGWWSLFDVVSLFRGKYTDAGGNALFPETPKQRSIAIGVIVGQIILALLLKLLSGDQSPSIEIGFPAGDVK